MFDIIGYLWYLCGKDGNHGQEIINTSQGDMLQQRNDVKGFGSEDGHKARVT